MDNTNINQDISDFIKNRKSLMISSMNDTSEVLTSYAPFVNTNNQLLYIFISDLAEHSRNIQRAIKDHQNISIMLIEDEEMSRNIFARQRLSFSCQLEYIKREEESWNSIMQLFQNKFDKTVDVLMQLPDFKLFAIKPSTGKYVSGFGKTYLFSEGEWTLFSMN